jgi:hypothetical protein|nr:MAG TPA: hypothetical protein [Crassvirales sp.]
MNRILDFLYASFSYWDHNNYRHPLVTPIMELRGKNLETKDCFQHFITVDISGDIIEVPVMFKDIAIAAKTEGYSELCLPIINNVGYPLTSRRSAGTTFLDFTNACYFNINTVVNSKGFKYHGYPGLILDEHYNPLFVVTCVISEGEVIKYKCKIDNKVFINSDRFIEKAIIKQVIPLLATEHFFDDDDSVSYGGATIENINLTVSPTFFMNKDVYQDITDNVNDFLLKNIDDIL